jgi:hypothetical protein
MAAFLVLLSKTRKKYPSDGRRLRCGGGTIIGSGHILSVLGKKSKILNSKIVGAKIASS